MGLVLFGKGTRAPMSLGLFGGYPGCNVGYTTFRNGNVDELPDRLEALRGEERVDQSWGHVELGEGDIQYVRFMGGGGYGDPLDRDPELVLADVLAGLVTEVPARDIYGVVLSDGVGRRGRRPVRGAPSCGRSGSGARAGAGGARRRPAHRTCACRSTCSAPPRARRSAPGAAPRSPRPARTGRTMPYCAGCPSSGPARTASRPASSS